MLVVGHEIFAGDFIKLELWMVWDITRDINKDGALGADLPLSDSSRPN